MTPGPQNPLVAVMSRLSAKWLPFADIATAEVPFSRFLRLSLFQLTVGMATTLFYGTLNRVMIVELQVPSFIVAAMIAIPLLIAPFRALIGFRSDTHRSYWGWKRVPFIYVGSFMQFGGLAIMPFALLLLSGDQAWGGRWIAYFGSALAFFLVGAGAHTVQTSGLALASDLADEAKRPRVVALMYVMMLVGALFSALLLGTLLRDFQPMRLIQVIQGAAVFTVVCNMIALWKQEARGPTLAPWGVEERRPAFGDAWRTFIAGGHAVRLLVATGLGFFAFNMQDVLLEPYGGEILGWSVAGTTTLTGIAAAGALLAFGLAARMMERGSDPVRVAALGTVIGVVSFVCVIFASPLHSSGLFSGGTFLMGMGEGLFAVGTLSAAMGLRDATQHGIALGAWGAVFATCEGLSMACAGLIRDHFAAQVRAGEMAWALNDPSVPYSVVYHLETLLLFGTLVALGPLVRLVRSGAIRRAPDGEFGLADLPA
jgi:BCD family chlorophyll transporter-like MFS transporter